MVYYNLPRIIAVASTVIVGLASVQPNNETITEDVINDPGKTRQNLVNFFDSIGRNDSEQMDSYRRIFDRETRREQEAFESLKDKFRSARFESNQRKPFPTMKIGAALKRELEKTSTEMPKHIRKMLPRQRDSFERCVTHNAAMVDKSQFIIQLLRADETAHMKIFIRPRRFGKSFFLSMLECFFENRRELFRGLMIDREEAQLQLPEQFRWKKYPVIKLDFSSLRAYPPELFQSELLANLMEIAVKAGIPRCVDPLTIRGTVEYVFTSFKARYNSDIVLLIDEYDSPYFHSALESHSHVGTVKDVLSCFYSAIKEYSDFVAFGFITGCSTVGFTGSIPPANIIEDISQLPQFNSLAGFTESEIDKYFGEYFEETPKEELKPAENVDRANRAKQHRANLIKWYNSYRFSGSDDDEKVCSPIAVLNFLSELPTECQPYWASTGSGSVSTMLTEAVEAYPVEMIGLLKSEDEIYKIPRRALMSEFNPEKLKTGFHEVVKLLYQVGFLTLRKSDGSSFFLAIANPESRTELYREVQGSLCTRENTEWLTPLRTLEEFEYQENFEALFRGMEARIPKIYSLEEHYDTLVSFYLSGGKLLESLERRQLRATQTITKQVKKAVTKAMKVTKAEKVTKEKKVKKGAQKSKDDVQKKESEIEYRVGSVTYRADYIFDENPYSTFIFEFKLDSSNKLTPIQQCIDEYRTIVEGNGKRLTCIRIVFASSLQPRKGKEGKKIINWGAVTYEEDHSTIRATYHDPTSRTKLE